MRIVAFVILTRVNMSRLTILCVVEFLNQGVPFSKIVPSVRARDIPLSLKKKLEKLHKQRCEQISETQCSYLQNTEIQNYLVASL